MMTNININPWTITGITDSDGSFYVAISKSSKNIIGWSVSINYQIVASINSANLTMFEQVKSFFGDIGNISEHVKDNTLRYTVSGVGNCKIIQNHFLNYPLLTYKLVYFQLWSSILDIMVKNGHLTLEGLLKIIALKAHFKKGLSELLLTNFTDFIPVIKSPFEPNLSLMNIHWLCGFINGDGHFGLRIRKNIKYALGASCDVIISISQDEVSLTTLEYIVTFLGLGKIRKDSDSRTTYVYFLGSVKEINLFINKFQEANLLGAKALDYADFCKGIEIINRKEHLTQEGLNKIEALSQNMNSKRTNFEV